MILISVPTYELQSVKI